VSAALDSVSPATVVSKATVSSVSHASPDGNTAATDWPAALNRVPKMMSEVEAVLSACANTWKNADVVPEVRAPFT